MSQGWRDQAACTDVDDLEIFFPDTAHEYKKAKQICESCPVSLQCLTWSVENDIGFGVWGGLGWQARHEIRMGRRRLADISGKTP